MSSKSQNRCGRKHKTRLMTVKKLLEEESDESSRFSVKQILDRLGLEHTEANARAIRSDIKTLQEFGVAIKREKHKTFEYYVASRRFKPYELKILVDIVQSSRSIDEQTSNELVESILGLTSQSEAHSIVAGIHLGCRAKTHNHQVFRNIDIIGKALASDPQHKVQFVYYDIGFDLEENYRYNGKPRIETPILLTYRGDCYYMVSFSEEHNDIIARRLDRMEGTIDTGQKAASNEKIRKFDLEDFERTQFNMFLGEAEWITLQINDKKMMNPLYDHFGDRLIGHIEPPLKGKPATARVKVFDSPQFRGWIAGMNGGLEVVEKKPETLHRKQPML